MNSEYPLVTCVTTTYKNFQYIYETLDSIFMQDYPNIEIVLSDDGSPSFPGREIEEYILKHKQENIRNYLILHEEENHGTVWNCSNCRNHANGVYIMGIASDDRFFDTHVISDVVKFFQKTGAEIVVCKRQFVEASSDAALATMPFYNQIRWIKKLDNQKLFQKIASFCFLTGANTYYTKSLYEQMGGYDLDYKYMEDYPFYLKLLRTDIRMHIFERVTIKYRYGAGASTSPHKKNVFREGMYDDRIKYMEKDILPYMDGFPFYRKEQMKARLKRFEIEKTDRNACMFSTYIKLFLYSPIGTIMQIWYQGSYKLKLKLCK